MTTGPGGISSFASSPTTFDRLWRRSVTEAGNGLFLRFEASDRSTTTWTYAEFDAIVGRWADHLRLLGVGPERGVHLALTNSPTFVAAWLAAIRLGSWIVPSDPMSTAPELAEHLARTTPAVSLVAASRAGVAAAAGGHRIDGVTVDDLGVSTLTIDEDDTALDPWPTPTTAPSTGAAAPPGPADRAAVLFTSGTTGRPKGVVVTQANYAFAGLVMAAAAGLERHHRQLVVLPLFHANAQYYSFASAVAVGAGVAMMSSFSASRFLSQAAEHGATHASLFAGPMRMILSRGAPDPSRPLRLDHCWFAQNLDADRYETLAGWLGCRPRQLYGMTETIPAVLTDRGAPTGPAVAAGSALVGDPRHDALGTVTNGCSAALHDDDGNPVGDGDVGEVVVGGTPGLTLFAGYLDDPETTAASFRGSWFRTGDRARVGVDGRWEFDGRRADVLKVAGENVSVVEVAQVIAAHPDVFDVAVVGAPDPVRDEVPVAFVVPAVGADATTLSAAVLAWCDERLSRAKRPRRVTLVEELPRTSVGKVRTFLLARAAASAPSDPSTLSTPQEDSP